MAVISPDMKALDFVPICKTTLPDWVQNFREKVDPNIIPFFYGRKEMNEFFQDVGLQIWNKVAEHPGVRTARKLGIRGFKDLTFHFQVYETDKKTNMPRILKDRHIRLDLDLFGKSFSI
jgi:hypothetical protein